MIPLVRFQVRVLLRGTAALVAIVAFAVIAGIVALVGLGSFRQVGLGSVGPAAASFVNIALLLPTAEAIVLAAMAVTTDRDGGFQAMLRARGVAVPAIVVATWAATTAATWISLLAGFGVVALILAGNVPAQDLATFTALLLVMLATSAAAAAIGVAIGALARSRLQAALGGIATWFALALGFDLAIVGLGVLLRLGEVAVVGAILADPFTSGRVAALLILDSQGGVLGPVGAYLLDAVGRTGAIAMLLVVVGAWTLVPIALASTVIADRS